jgi:hypothetical protein
MKELVSLIAGIAILIIILYDFFYTTLSGSGAAFLSKSLSSATHKLTLNLEKVFGRKVLDISGMVTNLVLLLMWLLLTWLGLFLVYSYNPEAIQTSSGKVASSVERLYFTGYVLSTLGIGNFQPTTSFFEILTSLFSFFGFAFFTTAITYLLSVSSAVVHKRSFTLSISELGENPSQIVNRMLKMNSSFSYQQIANLQQNLNRNSTYYQAYPVLHFYNDSEDVNSLSINIASLDEALSIMLNSSKFKPLHGELQLLRDSIDHFLEHLNSRYGRKAGEHPAINWYDLNLPESLLKEGFPENPDLSERRKVLTALLHNENRNWQDVLS